MKPESHLDDASGLSPEQLEAIMHTARQESGETPSEGGIDWRLLGYIALAGSIVAVLVVQTMG